MNTKRSKGIIGITLIAIMVASIFAVFVPGAVVSQEPATGFSLGKDTSPDPMQKYKVGDTINYTIKMECTDDNVDCVDVDVWDTLPNGTRIDYGGSKYFTKDVERNWDFSTVVMADWIGTGDIKFTNTVEADGENANGEVIQAKMEKDSYVIFPPPEFEFEASPACCLNMKFEGWAADNDDVKNFTWDFGFGEIPRYVSGDGPLPNTTYHVFASCGDKTVKLSGYSNKDVYNVTTQTVHVDCGPNAVATVTPSCFEAGGTDITFSANSSTHDTLPIIAGEWVFSDGTTSDKPWVTKENVSEPLNATLTVYVGLDDGTLCCDDTAFVSVSQCSECGLRIYGTFGEGPGDDRVKDPETGLIPENKPYTDPEGPFNPQHWQAPRKDFITFNPAIMDHNQGYPELNYHVCPFGGYEVSDVQTPNEKVFKRMWYEKEWFKDHDHDGCWDVVIQYKNGTIVKLPNGKEMTMCLRDWNAIPAWEKEENGWTIREWNNDPTINDSNVDIYGPAVNQEFSYMFLDDEKMPIMIGNGSEVLIPMAHDPGNQYRGLNSFDADGDGKRDPVKVESEQTVNIDIDGDGAQEPMDGDSIELSGNESVVLVLGDKYLNKGDTIQFFDHVLTLKDVQTAGGPVGWAVFDVCDNEGGGSQRCTENVVMNPGDVTTYYRGKPGSVAERPTFYIRLVSADAVDNTAIVEVGRMFGQTYANIGGTNPYWSQKAFMVDEVFYNVVAIKAQDNCIKYITFRQKLPKMPIKLYGKHLEFWLPRESPLPEMPPFNMDHEICVDVWNTWTRPHSQQDKIGPKIPMPPLAIDYISEDIEERYKGELKEIYFEIGARDGQEEVELWTLEWFWTLPWQYTELRLPKDDRYLVTLSWIADESEITIWDSDPDGPVANYVGERFKFWYQDCTGPIYIDKETSSIRLYGTFGEGPGDHGVSDPETKLAPENKPYTDPTAPFDPQHWQAPWKDFMTFNPAIMDHNQGYPELDYYECTGYPFDVQIPKEKVFKRMWYEKEWFKDHDKDGHWDVVIEYENGTIVKRPDGTEMTMRLEDWYDIPQWIKHENEWRIREWNNNVNIDDSNVDIYGPAINQDFTYMFTDDETMPIMIGAGSKVLIPMASYESSNGLDSFDADGDGVRDAVSVESERTIHIDIDGDRREEGPRFEPMDRDGIELSGDETVVLVLENKYMNQGDTIQFFDHVVTLKDVQELATTGQAIFNVCDNEGGGSQRCTLNDGIDVGAFKRYYRGRPATAAERPTFYLRVLSADAVDNTAIVEVGRMFGQTYANIGGTNEYWSQKAFMVDGVFYNVVAIKAQGNCIKYITFRQKLPKEEIKLYGKHLRVWDEGVILPEMPPFNMNHEILIDVQPSWTRPYSQQDKIGPKEPRRPLEITYVEEDVEERFKGELREIYGEILSEGGIEDEFWYLEWFHTQPYQYTAFVMPKDQLYLLTLAWWAPEAEITIWDSDPDGPMYWYTGERVKFWYDPTDNTDIYVNKVGAAPPEPTIEVYYDLPRHGGNGNGLIDMPELVNGILDYLHGDLPFGVDGLFDKENLLDYIEAFIAQERSR